MIHFSLLCEQAHQFEGWFADSAAFEQQQTKGLIECPQCGSTRVEKALMAPSVRTARKQEARQQTANAITAVSAQAAELEKMRQTVRKLKANSTDVGTKFAEEARKIHFGETEQRAIHGQASLEQAKSLVDDGVDFMPLPTLPEDKN